MIFTKDLDFQWVQLKEGNFANTLPPFLVPGCSLLFPEFQEAKKNDFRLFLTNFPNVKPASEFYFSLDFFLFLVFKKEFLLFFLYIDSIMKHIFPWLLGFFEEQSDRMPQFNSVQFSCSVVSDCATP